MIPRVILWNGGPSQIPFFSEEECVVAIELTFENEIDTLRDTINIISAKLFEDGIWVESFENGFPENGLIYYNTDGGGMTFSVANDDVYLGIAILRWVVEQLGLVIGYN